ncbi:hypothetical protein EDD99_3493 [Streptomyces sp. 846.5]|nr:hypothetical protein [Streptomyces sp. 846.5]TDU05008.1 hypothetical protein EDD99_3493 [Streptomyces sp. 846.5]
MRLLATSLCAVSLTLATTGIAFAQDSPRGPVGSAPSIPFTFKLTPQGKQPATVHPNLTEWCTGSVEAPFFLTSASKTINGVAKTTTCTSPAPAHCHLVGTIERYNFNGLTWVWSATGKPDDRGWSTNCIQTAKPSYACNGLVSKVQYRTEAALSAIATWGATAGDVQYSGASTMYCD